MTQIALVVGLVAAGCSGNDPDVLDVDERLDDPEAERCLDVDDSIGAEVSDLPWTSCDQPHTHEVFHVIDFFVEEEVPPGSTTTVPTSPDVYPGFAELESFAQRQCLAAFEPYVGISAFDSSLFYSWLVPSLASWNDHNDREVICVAGNANGQTLTGTIRDSQR